MSERNKPYSDKRWTQIPAYESTGKLYEVTYEEKVEAEKALLELKLITQSDYEENIKKLKQEYGIKN